MAKSIRIPIQMHPNAFSAFGADLVTNDVVALIELVKNAYDAFAYKVDIVFGGEDDDAYIEIIDNGFGMTRDIIQNAWAVIATPYKRNNPYVERGGKVRRVSGNKGLGRFSAARLGNKLQIITKNEKGSYLQAFIDWTGFANADNLNGCNILLNEINPDPRIKDTGTVLRISELRTIWQEDDFQDLVQNLSRLLSPFTEQTDFRITLKTNRNESEIIVKPLEFIHHPIYKIISKVEKNGDVAWTYEYKPIDKSLARKDTGKITWAEIYKYAIIQNNKTKRILSPHSAKCGRFELEIRAWDLDTDSIFEVSNAFNISKSSIRKTIRTYKGLSVYRDNILVLPKSEAYRDWIGLDSRRISDIGKRISTSQIVGCVKITAEENPGIRDTTDREKLVDTRENVEFCTIILAIVSQLENLRSRDRIIKRKEPTLTDFLSSLAPDELVNKAETAVEQGKGSKDVLKIIKEYKEVAQSKIDDLKQRLLYYGQIASVGSVAMLILHEIRGGMSIIKTFLNYAFKRLSPMEVKGERYYKDANESYERLLLVADSFAPLYRAKLRERTYECNLYTEIVNSVRMLSKKIRDTNIKIDVSEIGKEIWIGVHKGELQTILINLIDNAIYWAVKHQQENPCVAIRIHAFNTETGMLQLAIDDNGPGIKQEDAEKIFEPGVTAKPNGIGMGLVIVSEIAGQHGGKAAVMIPGELNGATFIVDMPYKIKHIGGTSE